MLSSVFLSVSLFKIWITDSTQAGELTPIPRRERQIRLIGATGVARDQQFQELNEVPTIINDAVFTCSTFSFFNSREVLLPKCTFLAVTSSLMSRFPVSCFFKSQGGAYPDDTGKGRTTERSPCPGS